MIVALLVSTGAAWESRALAALTEHPGVVVLKRCVDVDDLLATASAGQAQVAVLGAELAGLDAGVLADLHGFGVRVLAVAGDVDAARAHAGRLGVDGVLGADRVGVVADVLLGLTSDAQPTRPTGPTGPTGSRHDTTVGADPESPGAAAAGRTGRVIAVWGPGGGPGRTTLAIGLSAELARRRLDTVLLDADPYGGAVAQHLGVLDEVSGLLSAARLVASGTLDERFHTVQRRLSERLRVVTGLPRPDRWTEVRPGALTDIVEAGRRDAQVVIDTGFSVEQDPVLDLGARAQRNGLTLEALEVADEILVVGSADPVGLARLARAVTDAHDVLTAPSLRLVVNRMRPSLGWREADVVAMLGGFGAHAGVHFLPDDQPAVDKALVAGRAPLEGGESPLTKAISGLVDAMAGVRRASRA